MLTDTQIADLTKAAAERAASITGELLRQEAARYHVQHQQAPLGTDERTEAAIFDNAFTREMIHRGMSV